MERLSIFDIFKIGVGPSSSHTLGPWKAALQFRDTVEPIGLDHIQIHLYGSLSKTGVGHATDKAVQLGLLGYDPKTIDTEGVNQILNKIKNDKKIKVANEDIVFDPTKDIVFLNESHSGHPNTVIFIGYENNSIVIKETYFSVGGGFIERAGDTQKSTDHVELPFPVDLGTDLIKHCLSNKLSIAQVVYENEKAFRSEDLIKKELRAIFDTMLECVYNGCTTDGVLPGGLNVKRRAQAMAQSLLKSSNHNDAEEWIDLIRNRPRDFNSINKWISAFALAVNEENAAMGRVVTSPTNGAAGVIPAVLFYHYCFGDFSEGDIETFFFTAGEIGSLFKKGATISAAVGGCQAEIGVSSAMAAGGLTAVLGGSPRQVLGAAEIAMEHHLGLTCDPIGGLVQIPCIERNTMGAIKAITATNLALSTPPSDTKVNFDTVVKTMWDTAQDMNGKYKETSEGGLAFNLPVMLVEC